MMPVKKIVLSVVLFIILLNQPGVLFASEISSLETHKVQTQKIARERTWSGVVSAVKKSTASAQTAGLITQVNYDVGDIVPKGAVIVKIDDKEQKANYESAKSNLEATRANYENAESDYQRLKKSLPQVLLRNKMSIKRVPYAILPNLVMNQPSPNCR